MSWTTYVQILIGIFFLTLCASMFTGFYFTKKLETSVKVMMAHHAIESGKMQHHDELKDVKIQ